ncbi:hypothetical protein A3863_03980 [Priestia endophytica]|uniref:Uncharacterized protein n=1 Tax=Priestia endophytica TaxID=135735 RepID=A0AAX1Q4V7_9BACI|nr:hypothetical protein A3864_22245 [Priestia endophytica]RAS74369.1 hypothetical protein A4U60_24575 [Priestia endophytica]RAS84693.1 hypothetical protein A4R27_04965 [Priestia endophytica]RAS91933.1 hypothetical protein A3863_03980 [Priestia endophytica]
MQRFLARVAAFWLTFHMLASLYYGIYLHDKHSLLSWWKHSFFLTIPLSFSSCLLLQICLLILGKQQAFLIGLFLSFLLCIVYKVLFSFQLIMLSIIFISCIAFLASGKSIIRKKT